MKNVISFPKEVSMKQGSQQKLRDQKTYLVLSIAAVLTISVVSNEWVTRQEQSVELASLSTQAHGRGIASVSSAVEYKKQNQWEQEIAKDLSEKSSDGVLAKKPTLKDEMVYGFLEGRYGVRLADGKVKSLELMQVDSTAQAMFIPNKSAFLNRFKQNFALNYVQAGEAVSEGNTEKIQLLDEQKKTLGMAVFTMNEKGQVLSIEVQTR